MSKRGTTQTFPPPQRKRTPQHSIEPQTPAGWETRAALLLGERDRARALARDLLTAIETRHPDDYDVPDIRGLIARTKAELGLKDES